MYQIEIIRAAVLYPTSIVDFAYDESYINCQDYYNNNVLLNFDNTISEASFRKFVSPVTNALQCGVYYSQGMGFDDSYEPQYFTNVGNAAESDLLSEVYIEYEPSLGHIPVSNKRPVEGQTNLGDGSIFIEEDVIWQNGKVILGGGKRFTLFLVVYFAESCYASANINVDEEVKLVELRNSNPYLKQRFSITLSVDNE